MTWRVQRSVRGAVGAAVTTLVALTLHTMAGGAAPNPLLVGGTVIVATGFSIPLAGRKLSIVRLSGVVGISQLLFHGIFTVLGSGTTSASQMQPHAGSDSKLDIQMLSSHAHDATQQMSNALAAHESMSSQTISHSMLMMSPAMISMHLIAAVLTIAALYHGEAALRAVLEPLVARIVRIAWTVLPVTVRQKTATARVAAAHVSELHLASRRRGPPRVAARLAPA